MRAKILIIDDMPANLQVFCAALSREHDVQIAISGEQGIALARQEKPDLILLDVMMPGLDGFETCRQLKADAELAEVPLVFVTAVSEMEAEGRGLKLGAVDYLTKPINVELARLRIDNLLRRESLRRELQQALSQERLASMVFRHAQEGVLICDAHNRIIDVNPVFTELTGYSREEVLGQNPHLLSSDKHDRAFFAAMWDTLAREGTWRGEVWNRRKDGEVYAERLTISAVHNDRGELCNYIGIFSDITLMKQRFEQLEHLAHYDALTQLPNRLLLRDRLEQGMAQTRRARSLMAVCYLDLDDFKPVNDLYGHDAGDALLVEFARLLKASIRAGDTAARLGGDEFVVLLVDVDSAEQARQAVERIIEAVTVPIRLGDIEVRISVSIGVALFPSDGDSAETLINIADRAMYRSKLAGKNQICFPLPPAAAAPAPADLSV